MPTLLLLVGTVFLPLLVLSLPKDPTLWRPVPQIVLGWGGMIGVIRTLRLLVGRSPHEARPWLTLLALSCGIAATLIFWTNLGPGGLAALLLIVFVPLACTLHLVYLARRVLFA